MSVVENLGRVWYLCYIVVEYNRHAYSDSCNSTSPTGAIPQWHTADHTWSSFLYNPNSYAYSSVCLQPSFFCICCPDERTSCSGNIRRRRRVCISTGVSRYKFGCLCAVGATSNYDHHHDHHTRIARRFGKYSC